MDVVSLGLAKADAAKRYVTSVAGKGPGAVALTPFDVGALVGPAAATSKYPFQTHATNIDTIQGYVPFVPVNDAVDVQVVFPNVSGTAETPGPQLTVRAAIEYPEGTYTPLVANGRRDAVLDAGVLIFDPCSVDIPAGKVAYVRYRATRTAGQTVGIPQSWAFGYVSGSTALSPNTTTKTGNRFDGFEALITRTVTDGAMTAASAVLTSASAAFTAQDAGQSITVAGAGASGATLTTTISTFTSATQVTLAATATTTVSAASVSITPADKTMSGTIYNAQGQNYGYAPIAVLARNATVVAKTVGLVGDSITAGQGDLNGVGGWAQRALSAALFAAGRDIRIMAAIPYTQASMPGEKVANLIAKHATRFALLGRCTHILGMIGTNDVGNGDAAATIKANFITLVQQERRRGAKPFYGTLLPYSDSTDGWTTLTNQTVRTNEAARVAYNDWLRDGAPIDPTTSAPVAVGTAGAVRAAYYNTSGVVTGAAFGSHPAAGIIELADTVESARNSGKWINQAGVAITTDGTHPTTTGHSLIAAAGAALVATW